MTLASRRRWTAWMRWPDPEEGPYYAGITWGANEGEQAEWTGFELWSRPPGLERVNPGPEGDILDLLLDAPKMSARLIHDLPSGRVERSLRVQGAAVLASEAPRAASEGLCPIHRQQYPREHFEAVAAAYIEAPIGHAYEAIAERWPASRGAIGHWLRRCRALGLLPWPQATPRTDVS